MRNLILILLILTAGICFADGQLPNVPTPAVTNSAAQAAPSTDNPASSVYQGCTTYDDCLQNGLQERANNINSKLIYFSTNDKDIKYNLFDNITVKIAANICPPLITVYKKVNNINYMMDVFSRSSSSECTMYYSNITGAGKNRDSIVGQLEIYFCNQDELNETCDQALIYARENMFEADKAKTEQHKVDQKVGVDDAPAGYQQNQFYGANGIPYSNNSFGTGNAQINNAVGK